MSTGPRPPTSCSRSFHEFSPVLGDLAQRFFDERWIDAPVRPNKRGGAFCAYTTPSVHPFVMLNYTSRRRDVLVLAHELGHGLHAALAHPARAAGAAHAADRERDRVGVRRDARLPAPARRGRHAPLAARAAGREHRGLDRHRLPPDGDERLRGARAHRAARRRASSASSASASSGTQSQAEMLGDAVEITDGYRHVVVLRAALHRHAGLRLRLRLRPAAGAQRLPPLPRGGRELRAALPRAAGAGGSRSPEELAAIAGLDLEDPTFWAQGLDLVRDQLELAEAAAAEVRAAG